MSDEDCNEYLFEYEHDGKTWSLTLFAKNQADAMAKLKSLQSATYNGEVFCTIPQGSDPEEAAKIFAEAEVSLENRILSQYERQMK